MPAGASSICGAYILACPNCCLGMKTTCIIFRSHTNAHQCETHHVHLFYVAPVFGLAWLVALFCVWLLGPCLGKYAYRHLPFVP